jgi:hypothetical protein
MAQGKIAPPPTAAVSHAAADLVERPTPRRAMAKIMGKMGPSKKRMAMMRPAIVFAEALLRAKTRMVKTRTPVTVRRRRMRGFIIRQRRAPRKREIVKAVCATLE